MSLQCFTWKISEDDCPFEFYGNSMLSSRIFVIATDLESARRKIKNGFETHILLNADLSDLSVDDVEEKQIRNYIFKEYIKKNKPSVQNISKMIISVGSSNFPLDSGIIQHFGAPYSSRSINDQSFLISTEKCFIWNIDSTRLFPFKTEYFKFLTSKDILMPCELEVCIIADTLESARYNIELKLNYAIWINQNEKYLFTDIEKDILLKYIMVSNPIRICGTSGKPLVIVALN